MSTNKADVVLGVGIVTMIALVIFLYGIYIGTTSQTHEDIRCAKIYSITKPDTAIKKFPGCTELINAIQGK